MLKIKNLIVKCLMIKQKDGRNISKYADKDIKYGIYPTKGLHLTNFATETIYKKCLSRIVDVCCQDRNLACLEDPDENILIDRHYSNPAEDDNWNSTTN